MSIYADAAGDSVGAGFCAWTVYGDELLLVEGRWSEQEREHLLICDLELAASTMGLLALQPITQHQHVYSFTDNTVAMAALRSLTPATACMQTLTLQKVAWLLEQGVSEASERITSKANLWVDLGSRARVGEVMTQAVAAGLRVRRVDVPEDWRAMVSAAAADAAAEHSSVLEGAASDRVQLHTSRRYDVAGSLGGAGSDAGRLGEGGEASGRGGDAARVRRGHAEGSRGRSSGGGEMPDARDANDPEAGLPGRSHGRQVRRCEDDGCALVAEVLPLWQELKPHHSPQSSLALGGDA